MVSRSDANCQKPRWKRELANAFTRPEDLLETLALNPGLLTPAREAARQFSLLVPRGYAALMTPGDPNDPLLRQVIPLSEELRDRNGFAHDPVGDRQAVKTLGLLQKYQGRVLLVITGACAIHCRYCFRRHFPYADNALIHAENPAAMAYIAGDPSIREVILSGGDPLMLDDDRLRALVEELTAIPHLQRLRLHTRLPVVLPSRITWNLCDLLAQQRLQTIIVIHANHARELGAEARTALDDLRNAGFTLLNQSVLLRGVNDNKRALTELSEALIETRVLPYYLHLLDRVQGAAHFEVTEVRAIELMQQLRASLPGYLVPGLVEELPGTPFKRPLC